MKYADLRNAIKKIRFKPGEPAYLISMSFMNEMEQAAKKNFPVTLIDNSSLFKKETFKPNLKEGVDYIAVNQDLWDELQMEFEIKREARVKVLENGHPELYPLNITVTYKNQSRGMIISRNADMSTLILRVVMEFMIPQDQPFDLFTSSSKDPLPFEGTIQDVLKSNYKVDVRPVERKKNEAPEKIKGIKTLYQTYVPEKQSQEKTQPEKTTTEQQPDKTTTEQENGEDVNDENPPGVEKPKFKPCGMLNLGNTCYMNASIQCMASIPQFVPALQALDSPQHKVTHALNYVLKTILERQNSSFDPTNFKSLIGECIPFTKGFDQQDAHEFTTAIIEKLQSEVPEVASLFFGRMIFQTTCDNCKEITESNEAFTSLSLPVASARRVSFVPWAMDAPMTKMFQPPQKCILIADDKGVYKTVEWPALNYDEIYAMDQPASMKCNKALAIVRVRSSDGGHFLTSPILVEVPLGEKIVPTRLTGIVGSRINSLWAKEHQQAASQNWRITVGYERFKKPSDGILCSEEIIVEVKSSFTLPEKGFLDIRTSFSMTTASLSDLVTTFLAPSRLDQNNTWKCPHCGESTRAIRTAKIISSPSVLLIQLKRFAIGRRSVDRDATSVELPQTIEIAGRKFYLRSVANHSGGTGAGHYTALCKRGQFVFNFNDSKVSVSQGFPAESYGAYVLFYSVESEQ